ncbi:hypothetical protein [Nocardia alba]|uniref:hypothetical protein n=1 Tax=Nocardia alba TaxID=225051 RepID=UPI001404BA4A|nr:hypothetical protein [Nocardia alba]
MACCLRQTFVEQVAGSSGRRRRRSAGLLEMSTENRSATLTTDEAARALLEYRRG